MGQQPTRRPYVLAATDYEVVDDPQQPSVLAPGDFEEVPADAPAKPQTWADQLGLNQPTDSRLTGFLRGSGSAALDMLQGASSEIRQRVNAFGDQSLPPVLDPVETPPSVPGQVGSYLPLATELAVGGAGAAKAGKAALNAMPSATRAGAKFQDVMGAARNITIDTKDVGDTALRIQQLAERGSSMPQAVRKLLLRMTDPSKGDMVYEESRDFASNISRLSADEYKRLTPVVAREVASLSARLNQANAKAAQLAGKGAEYKAAMREYARAKRIEDAIASTLSGAKKALPVMGGAGLGAWLTGKVVNAIRGIE